MVRIGQLRFLMCLLSVTAAALWAQDRPVTTGTSVEKATEEWYTLASNLEQRISRLLPCDPRVRSAIEEVSRASEARTAASVGNWQAVAAKSREQIQAIQKLQGELAGSSAEWQTDNVDLQQEQAGLAGPLTDLTEAASKNPSLAEAQKLLTDLMNRSAEAANRAMTREADAGKLRQEVSDLLAAAQARQSAVDGIVRAVANEGSRWTAYYAARLVRAQTECAITGQGLTGADTPPRPAPAKRPAGKKAP